MKWLRALLERALGGRTLSDLVIARIRTAVPAAVGVTVAWAEAFLARHFGIGVDIDTATAAAFTTFAAGVAWHWIVTRLERRWPNLGWLLGYPAKPRYAPAVGLDDLLPGAIIAAPNPLTDRDVARVRAAFASLRDTPLAVVDSGPTFEPAIPESSALVVVGDEPKPARARAAKKPAAKRSSSPAPAKKAAKKATKRQK